MCSLILTLTQQEAAAQRIELLNYFVNLYICIIHETLPRKPKLELFARVLRLARRAPRPAESVRNAVHVRVHRDASRLLPRDLN